MTAARQTYCVSLSRLAERQREVERISRRYIRAGGEPVALIDTGQRDGELAVVELVGERASLGAWDIVCVLHHHADEETLVEPCEPISDEDRERLRHAQGLCDACRTLRHRRQTFIVRERSTGHTAQLGSDCIRTFTGAERPEAALGRAQALASASSYLAAAGSATAEGGPPFYVDPTTYLAHVAAVVRAGEYVPARATDQQPTWHTALERLESKADLAPVDVRRAHEILGWVASLKPRNADSYRARMVSCLAHEQLTMRELPLAASAVRAFNLHLYHEIRGRKHDERLRRERRNGDYADEWRVETG
jgi:hypothetical protein